MDGTVQRGHRELKRWKDGSWDAMHKEAKTAKKQAGFGCKKGNIVLMRRKN